MKRISTVLGHIALIRSKRHLSKKKRNQVLRAYIGLVWKRFVRSRAAWLCDYSRHTLLGFDIKIDRFESLYWIFIEIFVDENYYFKTEKEAPFIIDGGSNIGLSILYFKFVYPESKIIAFEPHPYYIDILKENLKKNNIKGVEVISAGLGREPGEIEIFTQSTGSTVYEDFAHKQVEIEYQSFGEKVPVRIETLSKYIKGKEVDFLKLDVEGAESDILDELDSTRELQNIDQLAMEYHSFSPEQNKLSSVSHVLEKYKYEFVCASEALNLSSIPKRNYKTFMIFARK